MKSILPFTTVFVAAFQFFTEGSSAQVVTARDAAELRTALRSLKHGMILKIAPGEHPGFTPCRNVLVKGNRIVFRRSQVRTEINTGAGTDPGTFRFENNQWFAEDRPQSSKPALPVEEKEGIHGRDPR